MNKIDTKKLNNWALIAAIICISFSLRAPMTTIGPMAGLMGEGLGVTKGFVGFITTLPLITFAVCSPIISRLSDRFGMGTTMMTGLILIVIGGVIRAYAGVGGLLLGTALVGVGICVGNVLIPGIVKLKFPKQIGLVTGIYITAMASFASIGAGISYPLAQTGLGWEKVLLLWSGIALLAAIIWLPQKKLDAHDTDVLEQEHLERSGAASSQGKKNIWKSPLAWHMTMFMGLQSLNFYSLTAWIPSILQEWGMMPETTGYMALWFQLIGIPASFMVPVIASRLKSQKSIVAAAGILCLLGLFILLFRPSIPITMFALLLIANGGAASFSWSMAMTGIKADNAEEAASLSGMMQSMGYALAAVGPALCGVIYDSVGSWTIVILLFIVMGILMLLFGILASKREKLFH